MTAPHPCVSASGRRLVLMVLGVTLLAGRPVSAQSAEPPTTSRLRLGPVQLSPSITLRDVGIDTNVYNQNESDAVKDFGFTLAPSFTATVGASRLQMVVRSATDLVYFAHQRSERAVQEDLNASLRGQLSRLSPFAEAGYLNTRERLTGEIDARARRIERRGGAGLDVTITPKIAATARADVSRMAFDADARFDDHWLAEELNRETRGVSGGIRYALTPLTSIAVSTEAATTRFLENPLRDSDSRASQVSVALHPRALISGSARVGHQSFRPRSPDVPDFSGLVGSANLSLRLGAATFFGFSFDRSVSYSYLPDEPYYVHEGYGASIRRQIVPQWDVTFGAGRSSHRYRRSRTGEQRGDARDAEKLWNGSAAIGYDLGPRTRFSVALSYQRRQSAFDDRTYDGMRVGSSIAYGF